MPVQKTKTPFRVYLEEIFSDVSKPGFHSFACGRSGNKVLIIGGKMAGVHSRTGSNPFPKSQLNYSFWVVDLDTGDSYQMTVPDSLKPNFTMVNPQFIQDGPILYICGGYGLKRPSDTTLTTTLDYFTALDVNLMIDAVLKKKSTSQVLKAIRLSIQDEFVMVTGGALQKVGDFFYLAMGQDYLGSYKLGISGTYTEEIRRFQLGQSTNSTRLVKKEVYEDNQEPSRLHRRDLNILPLITKDKIDLVAYGGVFTPDDQGWVTPLRMRIDDEGHVQLSECQSEQLTNNYTCGIIPVYRSKDGSSYSIFLGGIGFKRWDDMGNKLVIGDDGIPLPFTRLISTYVHYQTGSDDSDDYFIQTPDKGPLLSEFIGANSVFIPNEDYLFKKDILDFTKIEKASKNAKDKKAAVGYLIGGIRSLAHSTSSSEPSYASDRIFKVYFELDN